MARTIHELFVLMCMYNILCLWNVLIHIYPTLINKWTNWLLNYLMINELPLHLAIGGFYWGSVMVYIRLARWQLINFSLERKYRALLASTQYSVNDSMLPQTAGSGYNRLCTTDVLINETNIRLNIRPSVITRNKEDVTISEVVNLTLRNDCIDQC